MKLISGKCYAAGKNICFKRNQIAVEVLGKDFSGIVLMGALNKIAGIVSKESLEEELEEILPGKRAKKWQKRISKHSGEGMKY